MTIHIPDPQDGFKILGFFADQQQKQRDQSVSEMIDLIKGHTLFWPSAARDRLSFMNIQQIEQVLPYHPGHPLYTTWQSLDNLLGIFQSSCDAMEMALDSFHKQAQSASFFSRPCRDNFEKVCLSVNKCMYDLVSVSFAIRELSRRFVGKFNPEEYICRFDNIYTNNATHHFIMGLRKTLHHAHFAVAYYSMKQREEAWETEFNLRSAELLTYGSFNQLAKTLITGERVEVRPIFESYRNQVLSFYEWLRYKLNDDPRFSDYRECKEIPKKVATRALYSIILQQLEAKKFDPYDHLKEYFTNKEIDAIYSLPYRSKQQVDKMIALYDEDNACTDTIRTRVYKICGVASEPVYEA